MNFLEIMISLNSAGILGGVIFLIRMSFAAGSIVNRVHSVESRVAALELQATDVAIAKLDTKIDALLTRVDSIHRSNHDLRNEMQKFYTKMH